MRRPHDGTVNFSSLSHRAEASSQLGPALLAAVYLLVYPHVDEKMPLTLALHTATVMVIISFSSCCSTCGAVAGGIKRQRPQQHRQQLHRVFSTTFLSTASTEVTAVPTPLPLRHRRAFSTTSLSSWTDVATGTIALRTARGGAIHLVLRRGKDTPRAATGMGVVGVERPHDRQARAACITTRDNSSSSSSLSPAAHSDFMAQQPSVSPPRPPPPSVSSTPRATPCTNNLAVFAAAPGEEDSGDDDLERCRRLSRNLGVKLVVPRQEEGQQKQKQQGQGKGKMATAVGGARRTDNAGFKFAMLFDDRGRLALDQPGSGFNPLVVRRRKNNPTTRHMRTVPVTNRRPSSSIPRISSLGSPTFLLCQLALQFMAV